MSAFIAGQYRRGWRDSQIRHLLASDIRNRYRTILYSGDCLT